MSVSIDEFCEWLESLLGKTIRGRVVLDTDTELQFDRSAKITLTVKQGRSLGEILRDEGRDELIWHIADLNNYASEEPLWQYWDEFDQQNRG